MVGGVCYEQEERQMTDVATSVPARLRLTWSTFAHALGNVLIGIAIGIACYYVVTDVVAALRQRQLSEATPAGALSTNDPSAALEPEAPEAFDFSEWEAQDVAYWDGLAEGSVFGRLLVDRMELDAMVVKGHSRESLKKGPGWIDYTDVPGRTGNTGISGHRTTYGAPFRRLDELVPGDTIDLYSPFRRYRYEVVEVFAVRPDQVEVVETTVEPTLTLTACHPPFSAAQRLIARAKLVEVRRVRAIQDISTGKDPG